MLGNQTMVSSVSDNNSTSELTIQTTERALAQAISSRLQDIGNKIEDTTLASS